MMIKFTKMHGAGNDYIYVYTPENHISNPSQTAIEWSKPHFGIGSDGLILIGDSEIADFSMHIYNNDGSEAMMCGNGVRCVAKFVYDKGLTDKKEISVETLSGIKKILVSTDSDNKVVSGRVDMGEPIIENKDQLATSDGRMIAGTVKTNTKEYIGTFVSMGNPHFVTFVEDIDSVDVASEGKALEFNSLFPQRCNIEFVQVMPDGSLRMRVWERGSGITFACGTGGCATAVAAVLNNKAGRTSHVIMDGGTLLYEWDEKTNHVFMTGPTTTVFEGEIELKA
ncbi:MAG: diaminopimelate epimerase [Bacteroidaceae bacterium]|nr:diaminopimelate epimerase [Bacteroidaceae bacterium]